MLVEIGSITSLDIGQQIYEILSDDDEIELMFLEKGRSDAPFVEKQFGEFGRFVQALASGSQRPTSCRGGTLKGEETEGKAKARRSKAKKKSVDALSSKS